MGWQIVKQPNELYAIWSTVVDDFIVTDGTKDKIIEYWAQDAYNDGKRNASQYIEDIESDRPKHRLQYDYEYCLELRAEVHGDDDED